MVHLSGAATLRMVEREKVKGQDTAPPWSPGLRESWLALPMKHGSGVDSKTSCHRLLPQPSQQ